MAQPNGDGEKAVMEHHEIAVVAADKEMTAWECIRANPKIVLWTIYANIGSTMVGYENLALSICLAMPAFQETFASEVNGELIIPAYWQSAWNATYNVMTMAGSVTAGLLLDRFGRRFVFLATILCSTAGVGVEFAANNAAMFLGGKILAGFAIGLILACTQTYVSEVAPLPMRGIALSVNTIMMNLGMLIAVSSTFGRVAIMDKSAFRVIFAGGWAFPAALAVGLVFLPESPYWLVMKGRHDDARKALEKLSSNRDNIEARLVQMQQTIEAERQMNAEKLSVLELFRGTNLRRTRVILICFYMPIVAGAVLSSNAAYFLDQTGLDSQTVVKLIQIGISIGVLSSVVNAVLMMHIRHRPLLFAGVTICAVMYLIMGICGTMPRTETNMTIIGLALLITSISYGPAVGAVNAVAGETSAMQLRSKSMGLGQAWGAVTSTIWQIVLPYLFNTDEANLGGNIGWIFFGQAVLYLVVLYVDVPGTKWRTYEELDIMFEKRIPARRFEGYKFDSVDPVE